MNRFDTVSWLGSHQTQRYSEPCPDLRPILRFCQALSIFKVQTDLKPKEKYRFYGITGQPECHLLCAFCPPIEGEQRKTVPQYLVARHRARVRWETESPEGKGSGNSGRRQSSGVWQILRYSLLRFLQNKRKSGNRQNLRPRGDSNFQ